MEKKYLVKVAFEAADMRPDHAGETLKCPVGRILIARPAARPGSWSLRVAQDDDKVILTTGVALQKYVDESKLLDL